VSQADSGVLKNIMICPNPKCNNSKTNVKSEKQEIKRNEVLRNRYCSKCDTSFSTKEKINIITKKKPRPDKLLMNFRFYIYGNERVAAATDAKIFLTDYIIKNKQEKKYNLTGWNQTKSGKVAAYAAHADKKTNKTQIIRNNKPKYNEYTYVKIETKKYTIEKILSKNLYWYYRNSILKKDQISKEEIEIICSRIDKLGMKKWYKNMKNNKSEYMLWDKVKNELESFHKSVSEYIIKLEKEYNRNFFINYKIENKFSPWTEEQAKSISDLWKTDHCWNKYITSR